jgi:hypothetical protein
MDTPQKCHFTLGFCTLTFLIAGCPKLASGLQFYSCCMSTDGGGVNHVDLHMHTSHLLSKLQLHV